ncbi:MAG TPA: nucleotidyltransferase domain-containing protein [Bacteroidetes bacterium]|nr:nucleotidyltransferase domain-containing protein [Bacteroidota bacterium]
MNIVETVKKEINKISANNDVILFGSRARGDHKRESDWDFLILLGKDAISKKEKKEIRERLYEIELATDQVISSIIHTKSEWEKRAVTPIYQIIKEQGFRA